MESMERIKKVIVDLLGVDKSKITEDSSFVDDLDTDSLDIVGLPRSLILFWKSIDVAPAY
ncbi:unnamed protein product [marine sediment metagenome]|uniref:Carrier domain-containing protein n=1 Tax=marine sediment metagenome TaxID=412755 RepID=X1AAB0_9ZZZZ